MLDKFLPILGVDFEEKFLLRNVKTRKRLYGIHFFNKNTMYSHTGRSWVHSQSKIIAGILYGHYVIEKLQFLPQYAEPYYTITKLSKKIVKTVWLNNGLNWSSLQNENVFKTKEEAELAMNKIIGDQDQ